MIPVTLPLEPIHSSQKHEHYQAGSDVGKLAKEYMDKGALVPDEVVINSVVERLAKVSRM